MWLRRGGLDVGKKGVKILQSDVVVASPDLLDWCRRRANRLVKPRATRAQGTETLSPSAKERRRSLSMPAVLAVERGEESLLADRAEQGGIDVVGHVAALEVGKPVDDRLCAGLRGSEIDRRLLFEILVGDVDDLRIGDLRFFRQDRLGTLLIRKRQVVAFDGRLQKTLEHIGVACEISALHHEPAEQPRDLLGGEIDQRIESFFARE